MLFHYRYVIKLVDLIHSGVEMVGPKKREMSGIILNYFYSGILASVMIFVKYSLYLSYYIYLIVSNITLLIDSWRSVGWFNFLVVSRLGCFAIDCFGAAAAFHRILLDCSGISAMVVSAQRLYIGSKNNQKSCRCEWCRIIRANVTGIWIEITDT